MIYNAKSVFLVVNVSLRWLNNAVLSVLSVLSVYLVQVSLLLIGQQNYQALTYESPLV
jgi:hypothetical protein